jgi:hypothetical protein
MSLGDTCEVAGCAAPECEIEVTRAGYVPMLPLLCMRHAYLRPSLPKPLDAGKVTPTKFPQFLLDEAPIRRNPEPLRFRSGDLV